MEESIDDYLLGETPYDLIGSPKYEFIVGHLYIIFNIYDEDDYHEDEMIYLILKLDFEPDLEEIFEKFVSVQRNGDIAIELIKYGYDIKQIISTSLYKGFFHEILPRLSKQNPNVLPILKKRIHFHQNRKNIDFRIFYMQNYNLPKSLTDFGEYKFQDGKHEFEYFRQLFHSGLLKTSEDFNNLLYYTAFFNNNYFKYMIFRKGNFIIDYEKLIQAKNTEVNKILEINRKYWK